ncbi:MAG: four helix bundle protein [Abditibacteriota bacterium]|nr:four helix bundle protein [Abditibacteriota bacterium]
MENTNILYSISIELALRIIDYCIDKNLTNNMNVLLNQLIKSGTSVGANIREAKRAYSKEQFKYKLSIALGEAEETKFWLELLNEKGFMSNEVFDIIYSKCSHCIGIIVNTLKKMDQTN